MKDVTGVLMHRVPKNLDVTRVVDYLLQRSVSKFSFLLDKTMSNKEVKRVHELRIWPLSQDRVICTCHIGVDKADLRMSNAIGDYLKANYGFYEVTGNQLLIYSL